MLHQNRPVKETDRRTASSGARWQWAGCAISVLGGFKGPTGQTQETWSDLSVPMSDPISCAWDWTGYPQRYPPTSMILWFSWYPNSATSLVSTPGMPKNYLQLDTREKGSGFSVALTLSESKKCSSNICSHSITTDKITQHNCIH